MKTIADPKIKLSRKISEFSPHEWNKVFPPVLENYYFSKAIDEAGFTQFSFFYLMVYDKEIPIAAASFFTMNFPLDATVSGFFAKVLDLFRKAIPNFLRPKVLMCGLPMGLGRIGLALDYDQAQLMEIIYESMEKIAREEKASMLIWKDFSKDYKGIFRPLLKKGFFEIESLPSTEMGINFKNFEDFLKFLSPASREGLRRKFKKVDGKVKIDLEITSQLKEPVLSEAMSLYMQTLKKNDLGMEVLPPEFFIKIAENMPNEVKYFLWRMEGRLVAFAFCLVSQERFIDYYLGFDYSIAYQYHLYFVRFRDLLNWCISKGIKTYEMGVTGYEAKRRLGFDFVRLYFYMKHRNAVINWFFKIFSPFFKPENFEPVFKDMKKAEQENNSNKS